MATVGLMAHTQIVSTVLQTKGSRGLGLKCRSEVCAKYAPGRRDLPSTALPGSGAKRLVSRVSPKHSAARRGIKSVLEAPRPGVSVSQDMATCSGMNPTEALLERFAAMGPPNDTDHSRMNEAADRLFLWDDVPKLAEKQTFTVYELNEFDRDSPAFLEHSRQSVNKLDLVTGAHIKALGDQVPFTNKLYDSTLKKRLGITTGICLHMKNYPGRGAPELHELPFFTADHYETIMSWYFGDMGHISGMGPFINFQDTLMGITGGTGFFAEARGVVRLHPITPFKFMYTFTISGIPELPSLLSGELVAPHFGVESHPDALQCKPDCTLPNYTD